MKIYFVYYVVDSISESIVGTFTAVSDAMADKIFKKSIESNKQLELVQDSLKLYKDSEHTCKMFETFDEVTDAPEIEEMK